jgi:hypothetical protein
VSLKELCLLCQFRRLFATCVRHSLCPLYRSPSDFVSLFPISELFCVLAVPVASVDVDLSVPADKGHGNLNCAVLTKRQYVSVTKAWAAGASDF